MHTSKRSSLDEKIPSAELFHLASGRSKEPVSVLIQVDVPPQRVGFVEDARGTTGSYVPMHIILETESEQEENTKKIEAATAFLTDVLGVTPRWLKSARAFVANVTPEQLRIIAKSPLIKSVQPNRQLGNTSKLLSK